MDDTFPKQMTPTDNTSSSKEEQAHCNNKTLEKQPKNINKYTDTQNTDSQNTESENNESSKV